MPNYPLSIKDDQQSSIVVARNTPFSGYEEALLSGLVGVVLALLLLAWCRRRCLQKAAPRSPPESPEKHSETETLVLPSGLPATLAITPKRIQYGRN